MSSILPAMFQCLLGLECQDFTMIAADQTVTNGILILKNDVDKILPLSDRLLMGVNGDQGDILQLSHFVNNNISLYKIKNRYELDTKACVHFTRKSLSDCHKNGAPYIVNILMGGWDESKGGQLFVMDYLATCVRVPFAAHGFAGAFSISILDNFYKRDLTESQAYQVIQLCVREIHERLFINLPNFQVKVVSKNGISSLPVITPPILNN